MNPELPFTNSMHHALKCSVLKMPRKTPLRTYGRNSRAQHRNHSDGPWQTYFAPKVKNVHRREMPIPTSGTKQQTLTQIDFVSRNPLDLDDLDLDLEQEESEPVPPVKKRRLLPETAASPNVQTRSTRRRSLLATNQGRQEGESPLEAASVTKVKEEQGAEPPRQPLQTAKTPAKPIRREIPSSQTSDEGLLSTHSRRSAQGIVTSPLKDISSARRNLRFSKSEAGRTPPSSLRSVNTIVKVETQPLRKSQRANQSITPIEFPSVDKENMNPIMVPTDSSREKPPVDIRNFPAVRSPRRAPPSSIPDSVNTNLNYFEDSPLDDQDGEEATASPSKDSRQEKVTTPSRKRPGIEASPRNGTNLSKLRHSSPSKIVRPKSLGLAAASAKTPARRRREPSPFDPVLETETQFQAAFKPFSPSMLEPSSVPDTPKAARTAGPKAQTPAKAARKASLASDDSTQPSLPPPPRPQSQKTQTQEPLPPCPTSQASTNAPTVESQYQRLTTEVPGTAKRASRPIKTELSSPLKPKAVVISSSPPRAASSMRKAAGFQNAVSMERLSESPVRRPGERPLWDWDPIPDSQLLPDSIMQYQIPQPPGYTQDSLETEVLEQDRPSAE